MAFVQRYVLDVVTGTGGTATAFSPVTTGRVAEIKYVKDATNAYADGVDFTVESDATATQFWREDDVNASKTVYPVAGATTVAGAALLFATGGTAVPVPFFVAEDRLKITIAAGGNTKTGRFILTIV
jgi:hypothetical protein